MHPTGWLPAFLLTVATECPVYLLALRHFLGWRGALFTGFALNVASHPIAWSTITGARNPFPWVFVPVEVSVLLFEAVLLIAIGRAAWSRERITVLEGFAISLAANGLSAGLGLVL